jgi:hypothetical protein
MNDLMELERQEQGFAHQWAMERRAPALRNEPPFQIGPIGVRVQRGPKLPPS